LDLPEKKVMSGHFPQINREGGRSEASDAKVREEELPCVPWRHSVFAVKPGAKRESRLWWGGIILTLKQKGHL
jgi:hypothetical protein